VATLSPRDAQGGVFAGRQVFADVDFSQQPIPLMAFARLPNTL
jgi:hypothetical protein